VIVMEALSREFRVALPSELLYASDLVVIAETEDDLIKRFNEWKGFPTISPNPKSPNPISPNPISPNPLVYVIKKA